MSPESEADQQIIDIINNANNGISANDDEDYSGVNDASAVADKISRRKRTSVKADGAKQADPQTVPVDVDIDEETESFSKQVS